MSESRRSRSRIGSTRVEWRGVNSAESKSFGALLLALRIEAGLTQAVCAEVAGLSVDTVSALERGVHPTPYRDTVARLCRALRLSDADRVRLETAAQRPSRPRPAKARASKLRFSGDVGGDALGNLPLRLSETIGRAEAIEDVAELLTRQRLVTLTGAGGVGKTRVAIDVGTALAPRFADGAWLIDLSPLTDGATSAVARTVARALELRVPGTSDIADHVARLLRKRQLLMILDNCEHVVAGAAEFARCIVQACPEARVLATSLERLDAADESVYEVFPLTFPSAGDVPTAAGALEFGAVTLFVERARVADHLFRFEDEQVRPVVEICRRVDGIALGIELAAANVKVLGLSELSRRVGERLDILARSGRSGRKHHRTMRALVEWSFALLTPSEQTLLQRLAVFAGGFTLESVEAICAGDQPVEDPLVTTLSRLVERSQVAVDRRKVQRRYRLLEPVRDYALEMLHASGENAAIALRRARWAVAYVARADELRGRVSRRYWLELLAAESENVASALAWALGPGDDSAVAFDLSCGLANFWQDQGLEREALGRLDTAYSTLGRSDAATQTRYWMARSVVSFGKSKLDAAGRAIALLDPTSDRPRLGLAYCSLGVAQRELQQFSAAHASIDRALAFLSEGDSVGYWAGALCWKALLEAQRNEIDRARTLLRQARQGFEAIGDDERAAAVAINLAEVELSEDNTLAALTIIEDTLPVLERGRRSIASDGDRFLLSGYVNAAACSILLGDIERAAAFTRAALSMTQAADSPVLAAIAVQHAATVAALRGEAEIAARLSAHVDAAYRQLGLAREETECKTYEILMTALRDRLGECAIEHARALGASLAPEQANRIALRAVR